MCHFYSLLNVHLFYKLFELHTLFKSTESKSIYFKDIKQGKRFISIIVYNLRCVARNLTFKGPTACLLLIYQQLLKAGLPLAQLPSSQNRARKGLAR